jgi:hypothetical protein
MIIEFETLRASLHLLRCQMGSAACMTIEDTCSPEAAEFSLVPGYSPTSFLTPAKVLAQLSP